MQCILSQINSIQKNQRRRLRNSRRQAQDGG